jgi:putative membrane protein
MTREDSPDESTALPAAWHLRGVLGGVLMGLANLVPGISGGTMLVAAGVYPRFVSSIAELSTLRLRWRPIAVVGTIAASAALAILLLAGPVKDLVVDHRWIMYSLFIGLTLGGLPVVWRLARPATSSVWLGTAIGFLVMVALVVAKESGAAGSGGSSPLLLGIAGLAGASAMILPGVSGGYLLLLLGQYVPILSGIDDFKAALRARDLEAAMEPTLGVVLPVGIGVVVGVVAVSNAVRWLLTRHEKLTLGVLLGLLAGAVLGLWPFQHSVDPVLGETVIKGRLVTAENLADFDREDYPTAYFPPTAPQVLASLGLIVLGLAATTGIARLGRE